MEIPFWKKKTTIWGVLFCALGGVMALVAEHLNIVLQPAARSFARASLDLLQFGATTLMSLGLVGMILDMKGWKEYFENGLINIMLRPDYLKTQSKEKLTEYQIEVFKKYYKREDIDQEGRFLRYCLGHIHKFITEPYREEIRENLLIEQESPDRLRVSETLRYVCRSGEGGIQEKLAWGANEETLKLESLRFEVHPPPGHPWNLKKTEWEVSDLEVSQEGNLPVYWLSLEPFRQVDNLRVKIQASYFVDPKRFSTWRMIVPSRDVEVTIRYPEELRLQFIPFLLDSKPDHQKDDPGFYHTEFDSWIMPWSGFAWKLFPREAAKLSLLPGELEKPADGRAAAGLH
jgi:hypothetical protein